MATGRKEQGRAGPATSRIRCRLSLKAMRSHCRFVRGDMAGITFAHEKIYSAILFVQGSKADSEVELERRHV